MNEPPRRVQNRTDDPPDVYLSVGTNALIRCGNTPHKAHPPQRPTVAMKHRFHAPQKVMPPPMGSGGVAHVAILSLERKHMPARPFAIEKLGGMLPISRNPPFEIPPSCCLVGPPASIPTLSPRSRRHLFTRALRFATGGEKNTKNASCFVI